MKKIQYYSLFSEHERRTEGYKDKQNIFARALLPILDWVLSFPIPM